MSLTVQIPAPNSPQFDLNVKQWIETRDGASGPAGVKPERFVKVKDLYDSDFINALSSYEFPITRTNTEYGYTGDSTAPRPPTNLQITSETFRNILTWDDPTSENFWYIEVYRAKVLAGAAAPTVADAIGIATVPKTVESFVDTEVSVVAFDHYYWIRAISYSGIASLWQDGYIEGHATVNTIIDDIMDVLKGADPDAWSGATAYVADDRVLSGGKRWKCVLAHTNHVPPNTTYWERSGILIVGDVDGFSTVGIDGKLVVDDTVYARSINVTDIFVGMTIESTNFVTGNSGWRINENGDVEFNGGVFRGTTLWTEVAGAPADLDDIADGTNYSRVLTTSISAGGLVILDETQTGTYGLVLETAISAGKIKLSSDGCTGTLPTTLTIAKCTDANADQTSANGQSLGWLIGSSGSLTISATGKLYLNTADALEIQAAGNIKVLAGGDIEFIGDGANPAKIKWEGSSYTCEMYGDAVGNSFYFYPCADNTQCLEVSASNKRWKQFVVYASEAIDFISNYSGSYNSQIRVESGAVFGQIKFLAEEGGTSRIVYLDSTDFYCSTNNGLNLGKSGYNWNNLYVTNIPTFSSTSATIATLNSTTSNIATVNGTAVKASTTFEGNGTNLFLKAGSKTITYNDAYFKPYDHKGTNCGHYSYAWDNGYFYDLPTVADFYNFDVHDDIAAINGIKGSGTFEEHSGHEVIDDDTLPLWLLSKYKRDTDGFKMGDTIYDPDGKPYLSLKACISVAWGATRQLDAKVEASKESILLAWEAIRQLNEKVEALLK